MIDERFRYRLKDEDTFRGPAEKLVMRGWNTNKLPDEEYEKIRNGLLALNVGDINMVTPESTSTGLKMLLSIINKYNPNISSNTLYAMIVELYEMWCEFSKQNFVNMVSWYRIQRNFADKDETTNKKENLNQ